MNNAAYNRGTIAAKKCIDWIERECVAWAQELRLDAMDHGETLTVEELRESVVDAVSNGTVESFEHTPVSASWVIESDRESFFSGVIAVVRGVVEGLV